MIKSQRLPGICLGITLWIALPIISWTQIVLTNSEYQRIFVDTDRFDTSYLSQLEHALDSIESPEIRYNALNDLSYYWHTRSTTRSLELINSALQEIQGQHLPIWDGRFQITKAAALLRMERLAEASRILHDAESKVAKEDLPLLYTQLGYVHERRGQLDSALLLAHKALKIGEELQDFHAIGVAYSDLGNLFWKQEKNAKGLEYGLRSLTFFEKTGIQDLDYGFTLYMVGNCYLAMDSLEHAQNYYQRSIENGERYGFYNNLSDVYISLAELYMKTANLDDAYEASEKAIHFAGLLDNNGFMEMRSWLAKGQVEYLEGKYEEAINSITTSIKIATQDFGDAYFLSLTYKMLAESYAGAGRFSEAYRALEKYDSLNAIVFNAEADERISLLQTEYEVSQKESTIALQEAQLNQQKKIQALFFIIALLAILISAILFRSHKINQQKNKLLTRQNEEKAFLLKEIHHRVKNNLETVSSLLALQSAHYNDPKMMDAMVESQNRVHSMSIIHQRLYQGQHLASIEMRDYFKNLSSHILDSFGAEDRINLDCEMDELELDVDIAIPLGLIVNELVTNALKYAFPDANTGTIKVALQKKDKKYLTLSVEDNGIGSAGDNAIHGTGFGSQLIELLTVQLNGTVQRINKPGTAFLFKFEPSL